MGIIDNYQNEGDYAGPFVAAGGGYIGGIDYCYDPTKPHEEAVSAKSITFGNNSGAYYGYDNYGYWGSIPFGRRDK